MAEVAKIFSKWFIPLCAPTLWTVADVMVSWPRVSIAQGLGILGHAACVTLHPEYEAIHHQLGGLRNLANSDFLLYRCTRALGIAMFWMTEVTGWWQNAR